MCGEWAGGRETWPPPRGEVVTFSTQLTGAAAQDLDVAGASTDVTGSGADALPWIEDAGKVAPKDARSPVEAVLRPAPGPGGGHARVPVRAQHPDRDEPVAGPVRGPPVPQPRRRRHGGHHPGRHDRPDQGHRPVRPVPRGRVHLLRHPLHRRARSSGSSATPPGPSTCRAASRNCASNSPRPRSSSPPSSDRDPTVRNSPSHLDCSEEEVIEGLVAANGYTAGSLDTPTAPTTDPATSSGRTFADVLGDDDPAHGTRRGPARPGPAARQLDDRERTHHRDALRPGDDPGRRSARSSASPRCTSPVCSSRILAQLRAGMLTDS